MTSHSTEHICLQKLAMLPHRSIKTLNAICSLNTVDYDLTSLINYTRRHLQNSQSV